MSGGVGAFNKAASNAYEVLSYQEKEQLKEKAESIEKNTQLTSIDIRHRAAAVFKKIRSQVQDSSISVLYTNYHTVQRITRIRILCCSIWIS